MGFVRDLFNKEPKDVEVQDIQKLIDMKREEDRHLDYKGPQILEQPEQLSQWISAFLNQEGGLLIVGIHEDQPRKKEKIYERIFPTRIEFVERAYPKERVEQLIYSHISSDSRPIIGVYPVRDGSDPSKAIYLIEVPQGDNPPYQAGDSRYYRRLNATKYPMPHREIADFFGRRRKPLLILTLQFTEVKIQDAIYQFTLRFFLQNVGKAVAKHTKITASFSNLEIITAGNLKRIDHLRGGIPSVQFNDDVSVFHPAKFQTQIEDATLKVKNNNAPIGIDYNVIAEDMELIEDKYTFNIDLLQKVKDGIEQGEMPILIHRGTE